MMRKFFILISLGCILLSGINAQSALQTGFLSRMQSVSASNSSRVIPGLDNWFFLKPEIDHLARGPMGSASETAAAQNSNPVAAIVDFQKQLAEKGIELILLPVPAKAALYPDKLDSAFNPPGERLDYHHLSFFKELTAHGVQVLDLMPLFLSQRAAGHQLYCTTDAHWSPYAGELAARRLSEIITGKSWFSEYASRNTVARIENISFRGDLLEPGSSMIETLEARIIHAANGELLKADEQSPIILMGDSHTLVFREGGDMLASGAGLFDQLAHETGILPDLIGIRGSGSTASRVSLFRKSRQHPDYLAGKRLVIWCISVREFTESTGGWRIVPVSP